MKTWIWVLAALALGALAGQSFRMTRDYLQRNDLKDARVALVRMDSVIQLGAVTPGVRIPFSIYYTNVGEIPVRVRTMDTFCGCLAAERLSMEYTQPGKRAEIPMTFLPTGSGYMEKRIYVYFEQIAEPEVVIIRARGNLKAKPEAIE
jgi:hypothetical protein